MRKYRTDGPGEQYREQCHLYGLGFANLGYEPLHVAIVFIPRAGRLDGVYVWSEPWSRERAEACINRHATLVALLGALRADEHPGPALAQIPMTPNNCGWCEWALAGSADPAAGCPGDLKVR
jgi:hypothetical protein